MYWIAEKTFILEWIAYDSGADVLHTTNEQNIINELVNAMEQLCEWESDSVRQQEQQIKAAKLFASKHFHFG